MLSRYAILGGLILCSLLAGFAAEAPSPERARVLAILATIDMRNEVTRDAAEEALVKAGAGLLPAMREMLAGKRQALAAAEAKPLDDGTQLRLRWEIIALDDAIIRLEWGFDPRQKLITWMKGLKFPDGRAFSREIELGHISDPVLAYLFPKYLFYVAYFPPYRGGAAPPPFLLKQLEVPEPLRAVNIFAVTKDGKWQQLSDTEGLEAFFRAKLPPATSERIANDAAISWVSLSVDFSEYGPGYYIIPLESTARRVDGGWRVTGVLNAPKERNAVFGTLSVEMTFDAKGALATVKEDRQLQQLMPM